MDKNPPLRAAQRAVAGILFLAAACAPPAMAGDWSGLDDFGDTASPRFQFETDTWEAGFGIGYSFAVGPKKVSQVVQWDFQFPGFNSFYVVTGDLHDGLDYEAQAYRRLGSWLSFGVEADYQKHNINIPFPSSVNGIPILIPDLKWYRNIVEVMPAVKIGPALGAFRPYLTAGAGWALIEQSALLDYGTFAGGFDLQSAGYNRDNYLCAKAGGGVEFGVPQNWSLGADVVYNQIFAPVPRGALQYFIPRIRFDLHF